MKTPGRSQAGMNLIELLFFVAYVSVTICVAMMVVKRFGWVWGVLATPLILAVLFAFYSLFYWGVGFLPYPLGKPKRPKQQPRADDTDSSHVA
jgi:hypothetical protein